MKKNTGSLAKRQLARIAVLVTLSVNVAFNVLAQDGLASCLTLVKDFPLPGTASRLDYQSLDEGKSLLFMAHLGDNSVSVFNVKSLIVVKNIPGVPKPHGILAVPAVNKVYISGTGSNELYVLDENTLQVVNKIPAGIYPDGLAYDPKTSKIFVSDEHGATVTVIDAQKERVLETIKMGGEVGNTQYDPVSGHIYSAVHNMDELVEIDPVGMKISARYKLPGCKQPHGFFIEPETHYAFITGQGNASYVVFDLTAKKIISSGTVGADPDVLAYDRAAHLLFVSAESGVVSIFRIKKDAITKICEGSLAPHAHTVAVDPATHKVYFPLQDIKGVPVLRVMDPTSRILQQ